MKKLFIKLILLCSIVFSFSISCENENFTPKTDDITFDNRSMLEKADAFLHFSSNEAFEDSVKLLSSLTRSELDSWEHSRKFVSLRNTYETIIDQETAQADLEELQIRQNANLLKTMKHKFTPLVRNSTQMILVSLENGVEYKLFNPIYAKVLNKDGIVKIGKSIFQYGHAEIRQIVNGDKNEISKLSTINKNNQTENIRYYPVISTSNLLKNERVRLNSNERFCEAFNTTNGYTDLRLQAWSRGTHSAFYNYSYWTNTASFWIEMSFTRKTWYGSINHRSENYSSDGTWEAYASLPFATPPSGPQSYNLSQNFAGKSSSPTYTFWTSTFLTTYYQDYPIGILGTQNFQFVDINCSTQ